MLDFNNFLSLDKLAIIENSCHIDALAAKQCADTHKFVLGVNSATLESMYGTVYAFDDVTGRCVVQAVDGARVEAYDKAYIIPLQFAPSVLYLKDNKKWLTGKLQAFGDLPGTVVVAEDSSDYCVLVTADSVFFPEQAATYARAYGTPGLSGGPNKNPDAVDKAANVPSGQAEAAQ